jgi:hypothetical protein
MTRHDQESGSRAVEQQSPWPVLLAFGFLGYVIVGVLWADAHPEDRNRLMGFDVVDFFSQVFLWPLHLIGALPL